MSKDELMANIVLTIGIIFSPIWIIPYLLCHYNEMLDGMLK